MIQDFKGKHILVIGLGLSGKSAAQYLLKNGAVVAGIDRSKDIVERDQTVIGLCQQGMRVFQEDQDIDINQFDLVVVSPGVPPSNTYYIRAQNAGIEVIGEIELACRQIKRKKCLAITGSNGKTTVTLMTEHVLNKCGKKAIALGNVGVPLTSVLDESDKADIFVIELSSFQLETLQQQFVDAAVILNITPNHLDRHSSMEEYASAKISLQKRLKDKGRLFVEDKCKKEFGLLFDPGTLMYGYSPDCYLYTNTTSVFLQETKVFDLPIQLRGKHSHHVENMMASFLLCHEMGVTGELFISSLGDFKKPSHRIEFVRTVSGVNYYDDSKGTNIDAVIRAVDTFEGKIILIAGGVDKGSPYTPWLNAFGSKVKTVCAIGQSAQKIKQDLGQHIPVEFFGSLEEAVKHASQTALSGDTVLLSPGCSSYDMFKDYAHRGKEFQRFVNAL